MPIIQFETVDATRTDIINLDCKNTFIETIGAAVCEVATVMPFRIRFQTVDIGAYSPSNPAPIGIAIIGFNNYIL